VKQENAANWIDRDPELKCYLPGIPRAMYMPYPFAIVQGTDKIQMDVCVLNAARVIHMNKVEGPPDDTYMGHSVGRWEGDTLVVDVTNFNGKNWLAERGTITAMRCIWSSVLQRSARTQSATTSRSTIRRPSHRQWSISMPLYRRLEPNATVLDYNCIEFAEEFMYGNLRKEPLVKHWEGETMIVDITERFRPETSSTSGIAADAERRRHEAHERQAGDRSCRNCRLPGWRRCVAAGTPRVQRRVRREQAGQLQRHRHEGRVDQPARLAAHGRADAQRQDGELGIRGGDAERALPRGFTKASLVPGRR
jgi:hypothetical protein